MLHMSALFLLLLICFNNGNPITFSLSSYSIPFIPQWSIVGTASAIHGLDGVSVNEFYDGDIGGHDDDTLG